MSTLVFVDANILLYSEDSRDLEKQQTALLWLDELWCRQWGRVEGGPGSEEVQGQVSHLAKTSGLF